MLTELPTEFYSKQSTVNTKVVNVAGTWIFYSGIESRRNVPFWVDAGSELKNGSKVDEKSNFAWLPTSSAISRLGSNRCPDKCKKLVCLNENCHETIFWNRDFI